MRSVRGKLLVSILSGIAIVVLIAGATVFVVARSSLRAQHDAMLLDRANTFGSLIIEEDGLLEIEFDQPLDEASIGVLVRISEPNGGIVAMSGAWPPELAQAPSVHVGESKVRDAAFRDANWRIVALGKYVQLDAADFPDGQTQVSDRAIMIEVAGRTEGVERAEAAVLIALIAGGVFALLGTIAAVWFGIRRGLSPLRLLGGAVDAIDADDMRLATHGETYPDELQPIVMAIDELLARLRTAMERERRFTDAAAHELRTPIAELKTITDVADRWPEPERLQRSVKDAGEVVRRMEDLLESLLIAARGSTGDAQGSSERIAVLPISRAIVEQSLKKSGREDLTWSFDGNDDAVFIGPRGAVIALVRNLIENAAEYTAHGGQVAIRAISNGIQSEFTVSNGPVKLTAEETTQMFEPFWRADMSRSDRHHRGLGLAIVDSLAKAMSIRREVTIDANQRLVIRLMGNVQAQPGRLE